MLNPSMFIHVAAAFGGVSVAAGAASSANRKLTELIARLDFPLLQNIAHLTAAEQFDVEAWRSIGYWRIMLQAFLLMQIVIKLAHEHPGRFDGMPRRQRMAFGGLLMGISTSAICCVGARAAAEALQTLFVNTENVLVQVDAVAQIGTQ